MSKNCSPALNFCTSVRTGAALSSPEVYKKFQTPEWVSGIFGTIVLIGFGRKSSNIKDFCAKEQESMSLRGAQRRGNPFSCRPMGGVHRKGLDMHFCKNRSDFTA